MLLLPFLLYSIGAMMAAYEGSLFPLIGLLIMWGAIITYIVRSINQLKYYQKRPACSQTFNYIPRL